MAWQLISYNLYFDITASVYVKWDSGYSNYYFYDENSNSKSIRKVNEYRKVVDEMVAVGCRVERGKYESYIKLS